MIESCPCQFHYQLYMYDESVKQQWIEAQVYGVRDYEILVFDFHESVLVN